MKSNHRRRSHVHGLRDGCPPTDRTLPRQRALCVEEVRVDDLEGVHGDLVEVRYRLHVVRDRVPVVLPRTHLPKTKRKLS